jgi:hypothetical protein
VTSKVSNSLVKKNSNVGGSRMSRNSNLDLSPVVESPSRTKRNQDLNSVIEVKETKSPRRKNSSKNNVRETIRETTGYNLIPP